MARAPDETVERIKREISVQRLVEARGIKGFFQPSEKLTCPTA